jgi:hypothetical protein
MSIILHGVKPAQAVPKVIAIQQLPTYPIPPPAGGEALGLITWDQPEMIKYTLGTEVKAYVEMKNPSTETLLYAVSYYFLDPKGVIADEGFVKFLTDSLEFTCFYLSPQAPEPAFFEVGFSASEVDYAFGLRLLLCEMTDDTVRVIQECSRVQVLMASESTWNKYQGGIDISSMIGMMVVVMMMGMMMKVIK